MRMILSSMLMILGSPFCLGSGVPTLREFHAVSEAIKESHGLIGHGLPEFRQKRQISCLNECFQPLVDEVEGYDVTSGSLNPDIFFNVPKLTKFCRAYSRSKNCVSNDCYGNYLKDMYLLILSTFDGICVDQFEEFKSHIPCYTSSQEESKSTCDPRCGGEKKMKELQRRQVSATATLDVDELSKIMAEMCGIISCRKHCETEVITAACDDGAEAAALLKDFGITQFKQLQQQFQSSHILVDYWPAQCTDVINEFSDDGNDL